MKNVHSYKEHIQNAQCHYKQNECNSYQPQRNAQLWLRIKRNIYITMMLEIFVADRLFTHESANILLCRYTYQSSGFLLEFRFSVALNMVTNKLQITL
jgi:hypothetical protein